MVDLTPLERRAINMVIPILAEAVGEIGKDKSLDEYTLEEVVRLIMLCNAEYSLAILKILLEKPSDEEIPL